MSKKSAELFIDGYIGQGGGGLFDIGTSFGLSTLNDFISKLDKDVDHINVHINSGGGSVDEGFAIHDKLKASPYSITTIGEGMVGSIATVVFLAGDTRKMFKNSKFFVHNPYIPFADGLDATEAQKLADELRAEETRILNFYSEKTGKKSTEIKPFMDKETSFTSQEAIDMGFVTEIVEKESQNKKQYKLVAFTKNSQIKNDIMNKKEQEGWFKKIENMIKGVKNEVVAKTVKTSEGVDIWYDGVIEVGTKIFVDESMSKPAPDGVHTIGNEECTIKDGAVESIKVLGDTNAEVDALKAENETLKAAIETEKAKVVTLEAAKVAVDKQVTEIAKEIVALKKVVIGDPAPTVDKQDFSKDRQSAGKYDTILNNVKNKYGKK